MDSTEVFHIVLWTVAGASAWGGMILLVLCGIAGGSRARPGESVLSFGLKFFAVLCVSMVVVALMTGGKR